jgi:Cys-tRNA(Pro)/Cys-tRNA(Cys) deacylase
LQTSVENILTSHKVHFHVHRHVDFENPIRSPHDFASALNYPVSRICKTLVMRSNPSNDIFLVTCPVNKSLNFDTIANFLGVNKVSMGTKEDLDSLGFPKNGVSPISIKSVKVLLDNSIMSEETICVGGGMVGVEIELNPLDLLKVIEGEIGSFCQ